MSEQTPKRKVVILFSDTGGGHRSAAEAVIEALELEFGGKIDVEMVDFFKRHAPRPLNRMPDWYPYMVKWPSLWGINFKLTNGRPQARAITATFWPYVARAARAVVREHPADLMVSVHPLANSTVLKALGNQNRPPFVTVVTDMVSTHAVWFDKRSDLILVPTEMARERAIHYHMDPDKVRVVGQPVAQRYCAPAGDKPTLRQKLGWPVDKFTVVLVGGGDGMGPLAETAQSIAGSGLDVSMIVVAGRNAKLEEELNSIRWRIPTKIYGFTKELPDFMRAADAMITKAGPGTIAEAMNAGLPIILYAKLPGQEDGNVTYTVDVGAGIWAPTGEEVVAALRNWINNPVEYQKTVAASKAAARPNASINIARAIGEKLWLG